MRRFANRTRRSGILAYLTLILLSFGVGAASGQETAGPSSIVPSPTLDDGVKHSLTTKLSASPEFAPKANADLVAELSDVPMVQRISFRDFMHQVEESNLDLASQRLNVPIARGQLVAAKVYPDPTFQVGYGGDLSHQRQVGTYTGGISETVLMGGKIRKREEFARDTLEVASSQLEDFIRNLRAQAADTFVDGLVALLTLDRRRKGLQRANQILDLNKQLLAKGKITETGLLRARIAVLQARDSMLEAQSTLQQTLVALGGLIGMREQHKRLLRPSGNLEIEPRQFQVDKLLATALTSRADVVAARQAVESARAAYRLAESARVPDLTIGGAYAHFTRVTNPTDPSPAWDGAYLTLSVPIPISNLNDGTLQTAHYTELQAEKTLQAAELKVETDIAIAYHSYTASCAAVEQYANELLGDSDKVYKARLYSLGKSHDSLLEVLDAHNAINEVYISYYEALGERAKSLVAMEQAAGIWDINF